MENIKISIIGAGPAGVATSIQLKRLGYEPKLFEMDKIGGLLWNANLIENYPGFPHGISGPNLIHLMEKQLWNLDIRITNLHIKRLEFKSEQYILTSGKETFVSDFVVIASGTKPKPIPLAIPKKVRRKVHQDIKDLLDLSEKHIIIVGCGDAAFDQALNLSRRNKITILNRGTELKSLPLLVERALSNKMITYISKTDIYNIDLLPPSKLVSDDILLVHCSTSENKRYTLECDEIVFAIGRDPQLDFMEPMIINDRCTMVGDVKNDIFRQASISIGDGIMAAMKIHNQISTRF